MKWKQSVKAKLSIEQQELSGLEEIRDKGDNQLWEQAVWGSVYFLLGIELELAFPSVHHGMSHRFICKIVWAFEFEHLWLQLKQTWRGRKL